MIAQYLADIHGLDQQCSGLVHADCLNRGGGGGHENLT